MSLGRQPTQEEYDDFNNISDILANDADMNQYIKLTKEGYIVGILILNYKIQDKPVEEYNPKTTRLRNATKQSINYKYVHTELDLTKDNFKDAIENNNYIKDECWINTLYDIYKDNLLSPYKHQRYRITREVILSTINKTEENIKDGLTIDDILPFFVKYKLKLRVFDMFYKLIFRYDPPVCNKNCSPVYCMIKGDHVYTLNNDLKVLEQKINEEGLDKEFHLKVSSNYRVDERDDIKYYMIENVDDILKYLNIDDEKIYFIHKTDDLMGLLFQFIEHKYEPKIKLECGRLTWIFTILNNKQIYIKTQMLITSSIDGKIELDDADTYNKMLSISNKFNNNLFKKSHKSFYTKLDIDILDEYRTSANVGMITEVINHSNMIELDISKAFTSAFLKIKTIPIFNEFDKFIPYDNSTIEDYNLYIVQTSVSDLFLNKTYNLCYGLFLKELKNITIISYKEPSNLKEVNYDKIIEELYNEHISDDKDIDTYIKKLIGNVNFGLLEKSYNKSVCSNIYDSLEEATLYQSKLGGVIHTLQQYTEEECNDNLWPDWMRELDNNLTDEQFEEQKQMNISKIKYIEKGKPLYVLNLTAKKLLVNGFRYIKELLMQHHNFFIKESYDKLKFNGIQVFSIKNDAFTIENKDIDNVKSILNLNSGIGNWRISKTKDIIYPSIKLDYKQNLNIQVSKLEINEIKVDDEYDTTTICKNFIDNKRVFVMGLYPGTGKSYLCEYMEKLGYNILVVCPTNQLAQDKKGITLNKFFSVGMTEDTKMNKFDDSKYDVIIFDELYFTNIDMLRRIKHYADNNPDKIILGTGDKDQLEPVEQPTNIKDPIAYIQHCLYTIFPNYILLKRN